MGDIKWEVLWVYRTASGIARVARRDCGNSLPEAMRVHALLTAAGKRAVTLRCKNYGHPPPLKLQPYPVGDRIVTPLAALNTKGQWWCPYCMVLRTFVKRTHFIVEGVQVNRPGRHCPMCDISHRDFSVRKWNPAAADMWSADTRQSNQS